MENYNLHRFIDAQDFAYAQALRELTEGNKHSHWIWCIFPQQKGLGCSHNSRFYGLDGDDEARAYIAHPVLGERLCECCRALLLHKDKKMPKTPSQEMAKAETIKEESFNNKQGNDTDESYFVGRCT